ALAFRPLDTGSDAKPWTIPANQGKVQQLSASPTRRFLLFLDEMRQARVWDLQDRSCRRIRGSYDSGAFLDDDRLILVPHATGGGDAGRLVRVACDALRFSATPAFFARAAGSFKIPDGIPFKRVALSPNGARIAAASDPDKEPLVCVWETGTGRLTHWI